MSETRTCFKKTEYSVEDLLNRIDRGEIALPEIQRPFVWSNTKVRDLLDSMFRGLPTGYLLFWENHYENHAESKYKPIGAGHTNSATPSLLVIDGQQRLTSLYAIFREKESLDSNYQRRKIEIAFRPKDAKFEVSSPSIQNDPEWIPNISALFRKGVSECEETNRFIERLKQMPEYGLTEKDVRRIANNLNKLFRIKEYGFTSLEITRDIDEEQIAEIFVRINSQGVRLGQADFTLTLMSVFWDEGREKLEDFCKKSRDPNSLKSPYPFNYIIQPTLDQLLRVATVIGFKRAKLKSIYQLLRGKDPDTGDFTPDKREERLKVLKEAIDKVLNLNYWHDYLIQLKNIGFISNKLISSENAVIYTYALYLICRI